MTHVKVLNKASSPDGNIIVTFQIIAPQIIQKELLRHRMFSFSVLSMRALGSEKLKNDTIFIPTDVRYNEKGMQGYTNLSDEDYLLFEEWYLNVEQFVNKSISNCPVNVHKQTVNRLLEPFRFFQAIVTTTYTKALDNFFNLRLQSDVEPNMRYLAEVMQEEYNAAETKKLEWGEWYIPIENEGKTTLDKIKIASTRVARTSYGLYENSRKMSYAEEIEFADRLLANKHLSPLEACAMAMPRAKLYSNGEIYTNIFRNFRGFMQYRSFAENNLDVTLKPNEVYFELILNDDEILDDMLQEFGYAIFFSKLKEYVYEQVKKEKSNKRYSVN